MELGYFSGYFRLKQRETGGAGAILRFERVRPRDSRPFQPNRWREITPQFLDRAIRALKRWNFDLVTMDEVCRRAVTLPKANRFACLTFDGGCKDVITQAYPVLSKHGVPFAIYLPTAFPDELGEPWWLALEDMIAREDRISLVIDRKERRFATGSTPEKYDAFEFLASWMRTLPPPDLSFAIHDLCTRYSVDLAALSRAASMDWDDLAKLAADPLATIGSLQRCIAWMSSPVIRVKRSSPSVSRSNSRVMMSSTSPPLQNARPSPCSTSARAPPGSWPRRSITRNRSVSSR